MTFQEMRDGIMKVAKTYGRKYGVVMDRDFAFLKLYEEVGEFAQAVLIHRKKSRPEKHTTKQKSKKSTQYGKRELRKNEN